MLEVDVRFVAKRLSNGAAILILDTRSSEEFAAGCIRGSTNVCSSALIIRRLAKGNYPIELLLTPEDKLKYEAAKASDYVAVVVCDAGTASVDGLTEDSVAIHLLRKISRECKFTALLAGGYTEFQRCFRSLCSNCSLKQTSKRPSNLSLQLSSLSLESPPKEQDGSGLALTVGPAPSSPSSSPLFGREGAPHQILDHLYLGNRRAASTHQRLKDLGITRILNVTPVANQHEATESFHCKQIAVEDSHDVNMLQHLPEAFAFIEDARLSGEKVLVHCHAGMSRSVTVILAYLIKYYDHTLESAYDFVKQRKDDIAPNFSFMGQLLEFHDQLKVGTPDSGIGSPMDTLGFSPVIMAI